MQNSRIGLITQRKWFVVALALAGFALFPEQTMLQVAISQDEPKKAWAATEDDPNVGANEKVQEPDEDSLRITVLGPDDKPLAGAKIHAAIWAKNPPKGNRDYVCDARGRTTVRLAQDMEILRMWASKEGHVSLFANWWPKHEANPREFPHEYTFQLEEGTTIGGRVQNEAGEPIEGARVQVRLVDPNRENGLDQHPIPNIWLAYGNDARTTDAQGKWALHTAPAGDDFEFLVMLSHPDYIGDSHWGTLQTEQNVDAASFRDLTAKIVMHRGLKLSGIITDAEGKAVPNAVVIWGDDPYLQEGSQEVRTDAKGRYQFPAKPAGELTVTVVAPGSAPDQKRIELTTETSKADFQLKPGKRLLLRFIDTNGEAIPDVGVAIEEWRGGKALYNHKHPNVLDTQIPTIADKKGIYEWTWAPNDEVTLSVYKEGYRELRNLTFTAEDETEFEVILTQ
jgi:hypothetical protein